jgi:GTPase SAR1 family protein
MNDNAIDRIEKNLGGLFDIASRYLGEEQASALKEEYQEKKRESLLQVMLFGSYNAGKSSLINALKMEEVAAIGDIPKTAQADRYYWNGCYLLDTPGVNAPIEHEAVTEEQINRSELILFVIRQGDQDVKDVYERMFNMLKRDKQVFVVFNHELGEDDLPEALDRLNGIMIDYAADYDIGLQRIGEIPVLPINVKTALRARLKGSDALAEHSGIVRFESGFMSWLRGFDDEHHYLDRLRKYLQQCLIEPLMSAISKEAGEAEDSQLDDLQHQRGELVRQYALLDSQLANHIRAETNRAKSEIASVISESKSKAEAESGILAVSDRIVASTSEYIQQRSVAMASELSALVDISVDMEEGEDSSRLGAAMENAFLSGAKNVDNNMLKEGFLFLRKIKIPGIKGRWEKTLGNWAQKAGWAITAVVSIYEIWSASSEQDKLNEQQKKQVVGLHQIVEGIASDISAAILAEARLLIQKSRETVLSEVDGSIASIVENSEQFVKDGEGVERLSSNIAAVKI